MQSKGKRIEKCPRCGESGLLVEKQTVTMKKDKRYVYTKLYVAHYLPNGISSHGKRVNRVKWCYVKNGTFENPVDPNRKKDSHKNVTQTNSERYTKPQRKKLDLEPRAGFEPATPALPRRSPTGLGYRGACPFDI